MEYSYLQLYRVHYLFFLEQISGTLGHTPHRSHCRSQNPFTSSVKVAVCRACIIFRSPTRDPMCNCCYFSTRTTFKHLLQDRVQSLVEIDAIWPQSCGHGNLYGNVRNPYYIRTTFGRRMDKRIKLSRATISVSSSTTQNCPHVKLKIPEKSPHVHDRNS